MACTLRLTSLPPESFGAVHAGIVEHHDGEGIRVFLDHTLIKCLDDRLGGHWFGGGVEDQLPRLG